jgi:hypothetical protein
LGDSNPYLDNFYRPAPSRGVVPTIVVFVSVTSKATSHEISKLQRFEAKTIRRRHIQNAKYNPRRIKASNRAKLNKSLDEFGLVEPLVWNAETGNLIGGHRRLEYLDAVQGTDDYWLTVSKIVIDAKREKALNVMLNNAAAQGEYDAVLLSKLLGELAEAGTLELSGFSDVDLQRLASEAENPEAQFPITAKLNERYDFVVVFTENESDFAFLQTICGVRTERSYKKTGIGIGRAVPFARFLKSLHANRHSIDVQGGHDEHTSAHPDRIRLRPAKSVR